MLINKNTDTFITRTDMPNDNWINDTSKDDFFVVDDNSELGKKILSHHGGIKPIVENGKLVDVELIEPPVITPEPTLEERMAATESALLVLIGGSING